MSIRLGSITVDGVSLTVNAMPGHGIIQAALMPYTMEPGTPKAYIMLTPGM